MGSVRLDLNTLKEGTNDLELKLPKGSIFVSVTVDKEYFEGLKKETLRRQELKIIEDEKNKERMQKYEEEKKRIEEENKKIEEKKKQKEKEAREEENANYSLKFTKSLELTDDQKEITSIFQILETKDGNYISVAGLFIKIWDKNDGKCLSKTEAHSQQINNFIKTKDGNFVSTSFDKTIKLWNDEGKCLLTMTSDDDDIVTHIMELPNGNFFTTGGLKNTIKIWDKSGKCLVTKTEHKKSIHALFSTSDGTIITFDEKGRLNYWNEKGDIVSEKLKIRDAIYHFKVANNGNIIIVLKDNLIKILDHKTKVLKTIEIPKKINCCIPHYENIITSSETVLKSYGNIYFDLSEENDINNIFSLKKGKILVSWHKGVTIRTKSGRPIQYLDGHNSSITSVYETSDGKLLTGDLWGKIIVWNVSQK